MSKRLAPINALKAFEAAARHLSFSRAAEELSVTPAAVSQQIRTLENYLGVTLFHRGSRTLALTADAAAVMPQLHEAFGLLGKVMLRLRREAGQTLRVWMPPSFAAKWLVPKLHRFAALQPEIDLEIYANASLIGETPSQRMMSEHFNDSSIDVAIAYGHGDYEGLNVDKLLSVAAVPLCSPQLLADAEHPLRHPADLRYHTLVHDETDYDGRPEWTDWLALAQLDHIDASRGLRFNHISLALDAAANGQGVVLGLEPLAVDDVSAGRLTVPFGPRLPLRHAYYLVSARESAKVATIGLFRDWLFSEVSQ